MAEFLTMDEAKSKFGTKGNVRVSTESTSTIMETAATSETITTLAPTAAIASVAKSK